MTKHDRAKMEQRLTRALPLLRSGTYVHHNMARFVALEVDRAVRAERKAWRDAEELRPKAIRRRWKPGGSIL